MIIFTPDPYGVFNILQGDCIVFNLTGYIEIPYILNHLIPHLDDIGFDGIETSDYIVSYMNKVLNDPDAFMQLMMIMEQVYNYNKNIIISINNNDSMSQLINECLSSLINRRYGYPCIYIDNPVDLIGYIDNSTFSSYGIMNLDNDIKRMEMYTPLSKEDLLFVVDNT